ncbi:TRAP transporter substrate-binding protein [Pseudooceanicola spongiae]|jgi:tripartite ATP-independent transporter DctP family solute receptor|uniref:DctP family TRAP transporter solute-binding subunit n=1 Tax=Pseudooceanicola spongiae TaxID=2613965 RepID=A0A7L9WQ65_9RHOB|nr:TRAP transporter substrate-binding protein [Pseudooceanicola spongiae]QOL82525.1 DctP family TRAP transporter solute-binding subunit [Pseudooceanicola spongiae]
MTKRSNMTLTRRSILKTGLAGTALLGAPMIAYAKAATTLRAAHVESTESATHKGYLDFAQKVAESTDGAVEVKVFPAGQLGNLRDLYEGIKLGSVDITSSGPDYTANIAPIMVTAALYYSYRDEAHADSLLDGAFSAKLSDALASQAGMRILAWGELGWRSVFNTARPIETAEDFKGLKLRVPEAQLHLLPMAALGAAPTPIPYSDVYTSMQTGVVDGAEGTPAAVVQQKFDEVSKFYSLTRHLYNPLHLVIADRSFGRMAPEHQSAVQAAATEAFHAQRTQARADNTAALTKMQDEGLPVNTPDVTEIRKIVIPTWQPLVENLGAQGQELVDMLLA